MWSEICTIDYAILTGNYEVCELLMGRSARNCSLSTKLDHNRRVILAVQRGYYDIVGLLLDAGEDPMEQDPERRTPLHYSVESSDIKLTELLLIRGVDSNVKSAASNTPLIRAICRNDFVSVSTLIKFARIPVNVDVEDASGRAAIELAANISQNITEILLNAGAYYDKVRSAKSTISLIIERNDQLF